MKIQIEEKVNAEVLLADGVDIGKPSRERSEAILYIIEQLKADLNNEVVDLKDLVKIFPIRYTGEVNKTTYLI